MKNRKKLFERDDHCWYVFGRDETRSGQVIDTNEYLIVSGDDYILMDPGGTEIFPSVVSAVSDVIDVGKVNMFFCSHQDPDIMSSLPLWMGLCSKAKIYLPKIWSGFIAHFGHEYVDNFVKVPDEGMSIPFGSNKENLQVVPAHYCHSSGNISLYDPNAKILFSGDIGAALLPDSYKDLEVQDFQDHIQYMKGFHQRWMPSSQALQEWVARVRQLEVNMICPQHGAIFSGKNVALFLNWLEQLEVGLAHQT
ncbi:MAG: MBL fold metallo-hydrolase [Porticoccus sp.]